MATWIAADKTDLTIKLQCDSIEELNELLKKYKND